jgi:hypothetical protein
MMNTSAYGQRIKAMAIAGGSLTQVEGDEIKGWSQFGFNGGLGAIFPIKNWGINLETLFAQKGSFQKKQFNDEKTDEYRLRLNYFEVPLYVTYTDKEVFSFGLGGYWAFLLNAREEEHSGNQTPYIDTVPFNNTDIGFLVDTRVRIWKHLHIGIRYSQSLVPIRERTFTPPAPKEPFTRKQINQAITVRFIWIINESRSGVPE